MAQLVVDNLQGGWCDSSQTQPRNEFGKRIAEESPEELKLHMDSCVHFKYTYRAYVKDLKQQFNQSEGKFKIIFPFYMDVGRINVTILTVV